MHSHNSVKLAIVAIASLLLTACPPTPDPHIWYVATTGNDSNDCHTPATACLTLEAASDKAVSGDTIFILTGDYIETDALSPTISVVVDKDLTIEGVGTVKLDGDGVRTVMSILPGVSLNLYNLHIFNGSGAGAGGILIEDGAVASIFNSKITHSTGVGASPAPVLPNAGGIHNRGILSLDNVEVQFNVATTPAGGNAYGGGIYSMNSLTMTESQVAMNTADELGAGIYNDIGAVATLTDSVIQDNFAAGGIYNLGQMTLTDTSVYRNNTNAYDYCGGLSNFGVLEMNGGVVADNACPDYYAGICNIETASTAVIAGTQILQNIGSGVINYGTMEMTDVLVSEHIRTGIFNYGSMTLSQSKVTLNLSPKGAGIWNVRGDMHIQDSTIAENEASMWGGGLENNAVAIMVIEGTTITGNTAVDMGGGIYVAGSSGGDLTIINSTISGNSAPEGAGIANNGHVLLKFVTISDNDSHGISSVNIGVTDMLSSIVAGNFVADCFGTDFITLGHNLDSDGTCDLDPLMNDILATPPLIDPLANNGGPTHTHALQPTSPAVDTGAGGGDCPAADQRGVSRPQGTHCDIGAFELEEELIVERPTDDVEHPTPTATPKADDDAASAKAIMNANCREGPHTDYRINGTLLEGETAQVDGRNQQGDWVWILNPSAYGHCWVAINTVEITGDLFAQPVITPPDLPEPKQEGCYVYGQTTSDLICVVPCPEDAKPGKPCSPNAE